MTDLIDTTEMYLRTVYELQEEGVVALRARIAERLGHSGPTVSQTVGRMERDGLVRLSGDRHLELTETGWARATRVMRKHRLAERMLVDVVGLDWEYAHQEACRWEHVISERVERRIVGLIGDSCESPYGNPIPELDEIGGYGCDVRFREGVTSLTDVENAADGVVVVVRRIGESAQVDPQDLLLLARAGVAPGRALHAVVGADEVLLTPASDPQASPASVPPALARHLFVSIGAGAGARPARLRLDRRRADATAPGRGTVLEDTAAGAAHQG